MIMNGRKMSYQVGDLEHFKENDPEFKSLEMNVKTAEKPANW